MNPLHFLLILRERYMVALLVVALAVTAGALAGQFLSKRYSAETALMVDVRNPDPVAAVLMPAMMAPGTMGTQVDIIRSDRVA